MIWLHGLAVGLLAGVAMRDAFDLLMQSKKERKMSTTRKVSLGRALATSVLVVGVVFQLVVGVLLIDSRRDQARSERAAADAERERDNYSKCMDRYQQNFAAAYKARLEASTDVNNAIERVIRAVAMQNSDEFRDAIGAYIAVRDEQDQQRKDNPYPPLPDDLCGGKP